MQEYEVILTKSPDVKLVESCHVSFITRERMFDTDSDLFAPKSEESTRLPKRERLPSGGGTPWNPHALPKITQHS